MDFVLALPMRFELLDLVEGLRLRLRQMTFSDFLWGVNLTLLGLIFYRAYH